MLTTRRFARQISPNSPLMRGAGGMMEAVKNPSCLWEGTSTGMKVAIAGGAVVGLGSLVLAFVGPAKLMTTYLIAAAVGSGVSAASYYKVASDMEDGCGAGFDFVKTTEEQCDAAAAKIGATSKALLDTIRTSVGVAMMSNTKMIEWQGKTVSLSQALYTAANTIEATEKSAPGTMVARCLRETAKEIEASELKAAAV